MAVPIQQLTNHVDDSVGPKYQPPWEFLPTDTNTGVGGKYIYIGYILGDSNPVTSINFVAYNEQQSNPPSGWQWTGQDLKQGAGGKYIYMVWKIGETGNKPITALQLLVTNQSTPPAITGYTSINQDLNQGAGGPYIWPYYSTTISMQKKVEAILTKT
ncbi:MULTISPECIES: hypothetical protein [Mesorhizobium]|uniref:MABP domain-containing protein n=2 Tax=Mesorhizobium TaxID=68287 RepID=G6YIY6_9HYPH|nr:MULTISPECIES: hypothetical protein [Mesorhizobium]ANT54416.1 hypothetical protein A6B35_30700 [Mesorhizobium amorphae CCNWGS0123]EHH05826.1 hypothetical protein MEA186_29802 [Mesorhizobium amorphae CCNWGS0123]MCV3243606.1 hypothetical protein [Mesorhizobium sp. ZC-5]